MPAGWLKVIKAKPHFYMKTIGAVSLSFKRNMHPKVSKAELEVFKALSAAGLTTGMVTQKTIVLKATIPDFCWLTKRKAVYLDGLQAHSGDKQLQRDEAICELLESKGWEVLRIPYEPPLTGKELQKIIETIKEFVGSDDK